ncbi:MAG: ATP-binding protein [Phycisphaerae bacterium]
MRRLRLTTKLLLYVVACALVVAALTVWLYRAAETAWERAFAATAGGLATVLLVLVGIFIRHQLARPLHALASAAEELGRGNLEAEIDVRSRDEVGELADAFRDMADHLRQMYEELERRVAERTAELSETTEFLDSVLNSATEYAIIATDTTWRILTFNEGARRMFGYEPDEILGRTVSRLLPPEDLARDVPLLVEREVRMHGRHEGEGTRLRQDGTRFPVRTVTTRRTGPGGDPIGYTIICRDITTSRRLQQQLREYTDRLEEKVAEQTAELRQANAELRRTSRLKSQFLANMSHELRTPLNAIMGFAEAIRDGLAGETTDEQREFADDIHRAGHQLLQMINDILDFTKLESGAMDLALAPVDLAALVDETLRVARGLARRRGVEVMAEVSPRPLELTADAMKLKQVLYNLLSNAIKFTEGGGQVAVRAVLEKEVVRLQVTDTGSGIAPEDLPSLFEEFTQVDSSLTRKHEGTGLGLALTRRLVELHGGQIEVGSELGRGTTVTVTLLRDLVTEAELEAVRRGEAPPRPGVILDTEPNGDHNDR